MRQPPTRLLQPLAALGLILRLALPTPAIASACEAAPAQLDRTRPLEQQAIHALARELPIETKVGQLLMPGFVGTEPDPGLLDRAARGRLGGLFLLGRNVRGEEQLRRLTSSLDEMTTTATGGLHPLLATDFEGGAVNALRLIAGNSATAAQLGSRGPEGVEAQGAADAAALRWLGFNTNLAPVADVLSVEGGVIGSRAFSSAPETAAALSRAYLRGLKSAGVLGVMKHFPGHGATSGDSHVLLPVVDRSVPQLYDADLLPYRQAIEAGELEAVMLGHLSVPALDPFMPTSLSPAAVAGLLRDTLRFDGLVMTDELKMRAVSARFGVTEAALLAIQAGADILLADWTGLEQEAVFNALVQACQTGDLSLERIERSAARVLRLKLAYGLAAPELVERYGAYLAALSTEPPSEEVPSEQMPEAMPEMAEENPSAGPTPTPVPTPLPTPQSIQPTPVSIQPTPTRVPPTATATASPTATSTATRTATATRSST